MISPPYLTNAKTLNLPPGKGLCGIAKDFYSLKKTFFPSK